MSAALKLFDDYYSKSKTIPSFVKYNEFNIDLIDEDFVVSKTLDDKVISLYKDNIWDFSPYISNPSQATLLIFDKKIDKKNISEIKKIILLIMFFGEGRNGSQYSVSSIHHYFDDALYPLSQYAIKKKVSIKEILCSTSYLLDLINSSLKTRIQIITLHSLLNFLHKQQNKITKIPFYKDKEVFALLKKLYTQYDNNMQQTALIPSRILFESIKQRWSQIDTIENNMPNLLNFLKEFLDCDKFSLGVKTVQKKYTKFNHEIEWTKFIQRHHLTNLFEQYNVKDKLTFIRFIGNVQGTIKHLILAYSGMRIGELLNLQTDCLVKKELEHGVCRLMSSTSKLAGRNQKATWITTKKIERTIQILTSFNQVIAHYYDTDVYNIPLFISIETLRNKYKFTANTLVARPRFTYISELQLDYTKCKITIEDKLEIENIEFNKNNLEIEVGKIWRFRSHQYRRSLAVYSIQSGLVSLGALQIQLKHQFREMTLYYTNGASYAKQLFDIPKNHIANDINEIKPNIDALVYIKDTIFSEENLFGGHGIYIKNNINTQKDSLKLFLQNNRDKVAKLFKNGDITYTPTALGGCISTEPCDALLSRSFISCGNCIKSVIHESKLNNIIQQQKEFIEFLDKDSIEYRTEVKDLEELENQKKLFLGSEE